MPTQYTIGIIFSNKTRWSIVGILELDDFIVMSFIVSNLRYQSSPKKPRQYSQCAVGVEAHSLEHRNLKDDELDWLIKNTFRIEQATVRDISGTTDLINHSGFKSSVDQS